MHSGADFCEGAFCFPTRSEVSSNGDDKMNEEAKYDQSSVDESDSEPLAVFIERSYFHFTFKQEVNFWKIGLFFNETYRSDGTIH